MSEATAVHFDTHRDAFDLFVIIINKRKPVKSRLVPSRFSCPRCERALRALIAFRKQWLVIATIGPPVSINRQLLMKISRTEWLAHESKLTRAMGEPITANLRTV